MCADAVRSKSHSHTPVTVHTLFIRNSLHHNTTHYTSHNTMSDLEYKQIKWDDGMKYKGQWKDGAPHGQGQSTAPDGCIYTGNFVKGVPEGKGKLQYPSGETYEGEFKNGKKSGEFFFF